MCVIHLIAIYEIY